MKIYLTIFVIVVAVLHKANSDDRRPIFRRCPDRERYDNCGTACPTTCENYRKPPQECTMQCVKGCFCESPYIRNSEGKCVLPIECRKKSRSRIAEPQEAICRGTNEAYNRCGSLCPRTCASRVIPACATGCQAGCFCNAGYLRNRNNLCVLERDCN